jgi:NAD(P)-dependent dehydrogenase (short-subunit alcohol dehydrogenase family)
VSSAEQEGSLIVGLGRARVPAVERRLEADGFAVLSLCEDEEGEGFAGGGARGAGDVASLLAARAPGFRPAGIVIASDLPAAGGVDDVSVGELVDALDRRLATAGLVAKSLLTPAPAHPSTRVVFLLDWVVTSAWGETAASAVMGGLLGLARSWSLEFAPLGVAVNAVVAGPEAGERPRRGLGDDPFLLRPPTPDDVAHAVAFFLDRRSSAITGQALLVCGGRTAGRITI